jgi:hypothetical protein
MRLLVRLAGEARGDSGIKQPAKLSIRAEDLQQYKENQERLDKLTALPDIKTEGSLIRHIIAWQQQGKPGYQKV